MVEYPEELPPAGDPQELLENLVGLETEIILEELFFFAEAVIKLHSEGVFWLSKRHRVVGRELKPGDIAAVIVNVAERMARYNLNYRIFPKDLDLTKFLTFTAADLRESLQASFNAMPLFFRYISFLDQGYVGTGVTLRNCGESSIYAENLNTMLQEGEWKSTFCFFRAIDLAMDKCAIPRIEGLLEELESLGGFPQLDRENS